MKTDKFAEKCENQEEILRKSDELVDVGVPNL